MRAVLHRIGETYGFIDLATPAFSISLDMTVAIKFNELAVRRTAMCAKAPDPQVRPCGPGEGERTMRLDRWGEASTGGDRSGESSTGDRGDRR